MSDETLLTMRCLRCGVVRMLSKSDANALRASCDVAFVSPYNGVALPCGGIVALVAPASELPSPLSGPDSR